MSQTLKDYYIVMKMALFLDQCAILTDKVLNTQMDGLASFGANSQENYGDIGTIKMFGMHLEKQLSHISKLSLDKHLGLWYNDSSE